ncbi:MAG: HAD-IA family hydrolase [Bacteroidota bacterium]|nr:HAD-IA family hydrolase [Bacteroidota bacterium]
MNRISCIIFDLDGTLTRTNELIFATFNHVTKKYLDKFYSSEEIIKMFGPPEEITIERLVGKERYVEAMDEFYNFYETHHPRMANAFRGINEILEFLKSEGLILAIFTGKGKRTALIILEKIGIKNYFDMIITGSDVINYKPSADGIHKVMTRFGLEHEQVLMVGDSVADVKAAHEAGVKIAVVLWDSYGKDKVLQMESDYIFHDVSEFEGWLKNVFTRNN